MFCGNLVVMVSALLLRSGWKQGQTHLGKKFPILLKPSILQLKIYDLTRHTISESFPRIILDGVKQVKALPYAQTKIVSTRQGI